MDKLIDRPRVGLEVADEVLVVASLLKRREAEFLVELHRLCHRPDTERVYPQLISGHPLLRDQSGHRAAKKGIPYRRAIVCGLGPVHKPIRIVAWAEPLAVAA